MKKRDTGPIRFLAVLALVAGILTVTSSLAMANGTVTWNGKNGATACDRQTTGTVLWIFNPHSDAVPTALYFDGVQQTNNLTGDTTWQQSGGSTNWHFEANIPGTFSGFASTTVTVDYTGDLGNNPILTISGCNEGNAPPVKAPEIIKTARGSYDRECDWGITKSADPASQTVVTGTLATFNYKVVVTGTCDKRIENQTVVGEIDVINPNPGPLLITSLVDKFSDGTDCTINEVIPASLDPNSDTQFTYECDLPDNNTGTVPSGYNSATVTWPAQTIDGTSGELAGSSATATATPEWVETLTDECVNVSDTLKGDLATGFTDCVTAAGGHFDFTYTLSFTAPAAGTCADHTNTASFADNSSPVNVGEAKATVTVCGVKAALTIGYWGTHLAPTRTAGCTGLPNGTGCSNNGPWTRDGLGKTICGTCTVGKLGNYTVTTFQQAAGVFAANNCSNASTSNSNAAACLAAQLLAAQLNVWNGANTCICQTIKDAGAFLTAVGYNGPGSAVTFSGTNTRAYALQLKTALDNYNNNKGCP